MWIILLILQKLIRKKARYKHILAFTKYNSPRKFKNFIHNELERMSRKITLSSYPYLINSEPTSYCNYTCPFCPTGKRSGRAEGFARVELYEKLFREIGAYTYLITFHGWGEPLMHRQLPELIGLAHKNSIFTVVTTNASLLTRELSRKIISSELDYLIVSIDGISEESYQKYRIGGNFETVLNNLKDLISLRKEMRSSTPFIEWQFLVFRHNEHEVDPAKKLARNLGIDNIVFMPAYTEDASFDSSDKKYHLPKASPLLKRSDCNHLWSTLAFHWNGNVVPCCYDYHGTTPLGNLLTEDFDHLWNNQRFQESRMIIKNGAESSSTELSCYACVQKIPYLSST